MIRSDDMVAGGRIAILHWSQGWSKTVQTAPAELEFLQMGIR